MKFFYSLILIALSSGLSYSQVISTDTIHWSASKSLTWGDFKGDALDSTGLDGEAIIDILASQKKGSRFAGTSTYVVTVFDWRNSWVKPKKDSETYLKYFQVMFDIAELYSRKLRKSIKEADLDPYPITFEEKRKGAKIGLDDRIKQFKKESKLGTFETAVTRWYDNVKAELSELDAFKQAPVKPTK